MEPSSPSSLDATARIRLEGRGEVLEQALVRLSRLGERLSGGLARLDRDDVEELKASLSAQPSVEEALARADRVEGAKALAARVRGEEEALRHMLTAALVALDFPAPEGKLTAQLQALLAALKHLGHRPGSRERALFEGRGTTGASLFLALEGLAVAGAVAGYVGASAALGGAVLLGYLAVRRRQTRWWLMADRVVLQRPSAPLLEVQYEDITRLEHAARAVELSAGDVSLSLPTARPASLEKLLRSLRQHMGGATATAGPSAVLAASHDGRPVRLLVVPQGVWVVDCDDEGAVLDAVLPGHDAATLEQAMRAVSHLPAALLAQRLQGLPGVFWPADETHLQNTENSFSRTFERNGETLRVAFGLVTESATRTELDAVVAGWRR